MLTCNSNSQLAALFLFSLKSLVFLVRTNWTKKAYSWNLHYSSNKTL